MKTGYVYIMANRRNGTLYTGVTSDLTKRVYEHRNHVVEGFSKKYDTNMLVWYQLCDDIAGAIFREKQIKKWNRAWKLREIEELNPNWSDLSKDL